MPARRPKRPVKEAIVALKTLAPSPAREALVEAAHFVTARDK